MATVPVYSMNAYKWAGRWHHACVWADTAGLGYDRAVMAGVCEISPSQSMMTDHVSHCGAPWRPDNNQY